MANITPTAGRIRPKTYSAGISTTNSSRLVMTSRFSSVLLPSPNRASTSPRCHSLTRRVGAVVVEITGLFLVDDVEE
ncbi:MAG: hypothetical protein ACR2H3_03710 [Acidimicrobiales bacterium]